MRAKIAEHKKLTVVIVLLAAVIIGAVVFRALSAPEEEPAYGQEGVQVFRLKPQDLSTSIHTSGKVESAGVVEITTEMTGQITELPVSLSHRMRKSMPVRKVNQVKLPHGCCFFSFRRSPTRISILTPPASEQRHKRPDYRHISPKTILITGTNHRSSPPYM